MGHCRCLPIVTYGGKGTLKRGVSCDDHAIVYTGQKPPESLDRDSLELTPIKIDPKTPNMLDEAARINYGKIYRVEHNVKVRFIGQVAPSSMKALMEDLDLVWTRRFGTQDSSELQLDYTELEPFNPNLRMPSEHEFDQIVHAIDPQYGDILALPPSGHDPTWLEGLPELPPLPDSGPGTPF